MKIEKVDEVTLMIELNEEEKKLLQEQIDHNEKQKILIKLEQDCLDRAMAREEAKRKRKLDAIFEKRINEDYQEYMATSIKDETSFNTRKRDVKNNNWFTNCGSCMVDILTPRRYVYPKLYFTDYTMEFIEWLQAKTKKQINFDLENDNFGRLLKKIRKPSMDELEEMFKEDK